MVDIEYNSVVGQGSGIAPPTHTIDYILYYGREKNRKMRHDRGHDGKLHGQGND